MKTSINPFQSKRLLILAVFMFFMTNFSFGQSFAYKTLLSGLYDNEFPVLAPNEISDLSNFQILDTREKEEYEVSHIEGAQWVGFDTFDFDKIDSLDKEKPVLVYCTVGARSQEIGKKLQENGFKKVFNLYGGIIQWSNDEKPLYHEGLTTKKVHTYSKAWGIWLTKGEKVY
ncbi:rhodanese-like domain-containing protein [Algoriphagus machipongonensis]|nr:rhodanese-like domain-containing protein [Algoriphagus machipongonensis]